jgi:heat shock protein HtpX
LKFTSPGAERSLREYPCFRFRHKIASLASATFNSQNGRHTTTVAALFDRRQTVNNSSADQIMNSELSSTMQSHRWQNRIQTIVLLLAMTIAPALLGWLAAGWIGAIGAAAVVIGLTCFSPARSSKLVLRMYKARELGMRQAPDLVSMVHELARRAELTPPPTLYYVPSRMPNAFATGADNDTAVTDGLLRKLNSRELAAVLAHETAHIRNGDLRVMTLADTTSRLVGALSQFGLLAAIFIYPIMLGTGIKASGWTLLVLVFAPTITTLMQLGLSRTREFDADLGAVELTKDPLGMVSALQKIEQTSKRWYEQVLPGARSQSAPSVLRTHPPTKERVARLMSMARPRSANRPTELAGYDALALAATPHRSQVVRLPGWHWGGNWY